MRTSILRSVSLLALLAGAFSAHAVVAFSPTGVFSGNNGGSFSFGYSFSVAGPSLLVTSLGYFDAGQDGLVDSHDVGIFTSTGTLLVRGTVSAGVSDPLLGSFRYTSTLSGSRLLAAGDYVIAGVSPGSGDDYGLFSGSQGAAAGLTYGSPQFTGSTVLAFPDQGDGGSFGGYFGPNFTFESAPAVPGPVAALPFALMALRRRKKA